MYKHIPAQDYNRAKELAYIIIQHQFHYFSEDNPQIPDNEYDALVQELTELERQYPDLKDEFSPTQFVGSRPDNRFASVKHQVPMLSLGNVFNTTDLRAFDANIRKLLKIDYVEYTTELKLDGLAISLIYEYGQLTLATTRGDGQVGEDVTHTVVLIPSVPKKIIGRQLPQRLEIRGEALISKQDFYHLREEAINSGVKPYVNPRNAAAGMVRQLTGDPEKLKYLSFYAYQVAGNKIADTQNSTLDMLKALGFQVDHNIGYCEGIDAAIDYYKEIEETRDKLPYEIDGVVLKVDDIYRQAMLGTTRREPHWAIAYKFSPSSETSVLLDVIPQVGRTGVITPVGKIKPVIVGGVTVSSVNLHNYSEICLLDLAIGDTIEVSRMGDVIPKVTGVLERPEVRYMIIPPTKCPVCLRPTTRDINGVFLRCSSKDGCQGQMVERLCHFGSRAGMDIVGLGPVWATRLMERGLVEKPSDLFALTKEQISNERFPGVGVRSINKLLKAIQESRSTTLQKLIYALGIQGVGENTAFQLASYYGSLGRLIVTPMRELENVPTIGSQSAAWIWEYFQNPDHLRELERLQQLGVKWLEDGGSYAPKVPLEGDVWVVTGKFSAHRDDIKAELARLGCRTVGAVSHKVKGVLAGDKPSPSKLNEANRLGIPVWNEDNFRSAFFGR